MENLLTKIEETWGTFKLNADKREKGNKAAGVRARKASIELAKLLKEYRAQSVLRGYPAESEW